MKIHLPFLPMFGPAMLADIKICTARTSRKGKPGDTFDAFGATFELLSVEDVALCEVRSLWREEGCRSPEHFQAVWNGIHPRTGYQPTQRVYLHRFKRLQDPTR